MSINDTTKICSKCNKPYPATAEYFHAHKHAKDGLYSWCKICCREHRQANKDKIARYNREYKKANKSEIDEYNRTYYQANQDRERERGREYYQENPNKIREYYRKNKDKFAEYYQINRDKRLREMREYNSANRGKLSEKSRKYRLVNKAVITEKDREYRLANPDKGRIYRLRRRARKQSLPDIFTLDQWITCLEYFGYACVVCSVSFDDIQSHADHWIPLASDECTGTIATNMVCLCSSCNHSKQATMPDVWLIERYGVDRANEILARVNDYFEIVSKI